MSDQGMRSTRCFKRHFLVNSGISSNLCSLSSKPY